MKITTMKYFTTTLDVLHISLHFMTILSILIIIFLKPSVATDTVTISQSLSVEQTLVSSSNTFELGFFRPGKSSKLYIGIWYKNIPSRKPFWVANREIPLLASDTKSILAIQQDGNIGILNGTKNTIWSTNVNSSKINGTVAVLSDKGNLILKDNVTGSMLWQSFDYPCDTLMAGMKIGMNERTGDYKFLTSWKTEDDPSVGEFVLGFTTEKPTQNFVWKGPKKLEPYWRSGAWNGWTFIGLHGTYGGYSNGYVIAQDNQQGSVYGSYNPPSVTQVLIELLTSDGNLNVTRYDTQNPGLVDSRAAVEIPCDVYNFCGPFGFCDRSKSTFETISKSTCKCLKGFVPKLEEEWRKGNWTLGCVRRTELPCRKNGTHLTKEKNDVFAKMVLMKAPDYHIFMVSADSSGCEQQCSNNCSCEAYSFVDGIGCLIWSGNLLDMQQFDSGGGDLFIRLAYSESGEDHKWIKLIIILTALFGVTFLAISVYVLYRRKINQREGQEGNRRDLTGTPSRRLLEDIWGHRSNQTEASDLPIFNFESLLAATNNFSQENKLGEGGFGAVYKGKLENGQEIAVKRLSEHSGQGNVEFKNEILLISKLKHRNLVTLLGYCIKGDEKLLIYEYLSNNSLDNFLFDENSEVQFDWDKRCDIIQGIARGLLYLHRDSCLRVIHRDLKASNILLDDQVNPKISDFGLARGFEITQELANTHQVVGTFGYMSPEYALGGSYSEKSDVFSFGVLLLEIISGMKNTSIHYQEKYLNLLGYAWHLWEQGRSFDLMDKRLNNTSVQEEFTKYMQIGLLCVQDHAVNRPPMSLVVQMLTSDMDISQPKQPTFYQGLLNSDLHSHSSAALSKNYISMSIIEGR